MAKEPAIERFGAFAEAISVVRCLDVDVAFCVVAEQGGDRGALMRGVGVFPRSVDECDFLHRQPAVGVCFGVESARCVVTVTVCADVAGLETS